MDLTMARRHLLEAERHVALSEGHVARQLAIVKRLESAGHPIGLACDVLDTFRMLLASHIDHRDLIRREIDDWKAVRNVGT
ncbi:hypothetical protein [Bradyrhizobium sp. CCBAU 51627]|uniref:hypothetical protein n=1 Tax=Bradyrhizobium sp. CCBAU 51627 TaxID=1325088 RepID=UPI002306581F|nr:hypothetical protein [Bradyrhizobium sp. CCBAU 51627]MDA9436250.1 hypothetical protein [Bradyrhizobium sp. CCBAU 51627]